MEKNIQRAMRKWLAKVATSRDAYLVKQGKISFTFSGGIFAYEEALDHVKIRRRTIFQVDGKKELLRLQ